MGRVDVGGVGIEYDVTGPGPAVVLLHGFPDSGRVWRHQVPTLAAAGYRVIVPDLRGAVPEVVVHPASPALPGLRSLCRPARQTRHCSHKTGVVGALVTNLGCTSRAQVAAWVTVSQPDDHGRSEPDQNRERPRAAGRLGARQVHRLAG